VQITAIIQHFILGLRDRFQQFGSLDVLVNNRVSLIRDRIRTLPKPAPTMEVNATGLFAISRAFLN
jgi:hypothetical protein